MKIFLSKKITFLIAICLMGLVGCIASNVNTNVNNSSKETSKEAFEKIISFGEWLYKGGNQPQIKYYIEKESGKGDISFAAVMTMYHNDELVGINNFRASLQENINIDYFVISPDENKVVTKVELKDIYLDGKKYSLTKTFFIKAE